MLAGSPTTARPKMQQTHSASRADARVQAVCRYIEAHADQPLTLAELGRQVQLSPAYLQRRFKAVVGITPKQYADACRLRGLKQNLRADETVTTAIYACGYGSPSRVYGRAAQRLGMTPGQYRAAGKGLDIAYAATHTPLGCLMLAATESGLCYVQFGDDQPSLFAALQTEFPAARLRAMPESASAPFNAWMRGLTSYLQDTRLPLDLPLDIRGTAFQTQVWAYLRRIPSGQTQSYQQVAEGIGRPQAVRAVANACAANRLALVIPCHRVIRGDGGLGGYRWGVERKQALLAREQLR